MTTIATERLRLRRWQDSDRLPFAELNADPDVMRYFPAPLTRSQSDTFIDRIERQFDRHGFGLWALEHQDSGEFLGFTGLAWQDFPAAFTPAVEVGWRLARSAWGHGYATEAARAALAYGFTRAGLSEIVSLTTVTNEPSQAVMRRIGLRRDVDGDFDHPRVPDGSPLKPHVLYRITRADWQQQDGGRPEVGG